MPGLGRVPIPRPENLVFYFGLALLVAANNIDWPLLGQLGIHWPTAVFIAIGHAITSRADRTSRETAAATAAAIDQLRTEIRRLNEMLRRNGEGDQAPRRARTGTISNLLAGYVEVAEIDDKMRPVETAGSAIARR